MGYNIDCKIQRLSKLQKRAAWIILKANLDTPSSLTFQELNWLSVKEPIEIYIKAVLAYRSLNTLTPDYLTVINILIRNTFFKLKIIREQAAAHTIVMYNILK